METTARSGPQRAPLPAQDEPAIRELLPLVQRMANTDGSDDLKPLTRALIAAIQSYLIAVQADPDLARALCTAQPAISGVGSPSVLANERILQGALHALSIYGLNADERHRIVTLARDAGRRAGMDHLTIGVAA